MVAEIWRVVEMLRSG